MHIQDFDFYLPAHLIAQHPVEHRSDSRLLVVDSGRQSLEDSDFRNIANLINPGDCLIFNDTRVIKARLFGQKTSGGNIEVLVERVLNSHEALAQIRASRSPKPGSKINLGQQFDAEIIDRDNDLFHLKFLSETPVHEILELAGHLPLPPYISHIANKEDESRYQTIFAKHAGAVAAPTAGLHFDEVLLSTIEQKGIQIGYITLHVGAGTFQPVRVENIADHKMHSEQYMIPQSTADLIAQTKSRGGKVIAVGTTSLRALESAANQNAESLSGHGETDIFITPGYQFKVVDRLITNFHLPQSTLLMLVSAFAGLDLIKLAYQHAIEQQYRFFSYGDAMLLTKKSQD